MAETRAAIFVEAGRIVLDEKPIPDVGPLDARMRTGDTVAVFAQGPIGLYATAGTKLSGATTIITVDGLAQQLAISRQVGADLTLNFRECDPVEENMRITDGRSVDVAIETLGTQQTFENRLRVLRPGGTLSSLGVPAICVSCSGRSARV